MKTIASKQQVGIFRASLLVLWSVAIAWPLSAAEPKPQEPAAGDGSGKAELRLFFDEDLATFPLERFKTIRNGESEIKLGEHWIWKSGIAFVRPLRVGTTAELTAKFEFPPLAKDGDSAETRIGWVFADQQVGTVAFVQTHKEGKTTGEIRVLREMGGARPFGLTMRSFPLEGEIPGGEWKLRVRSGALMIEHEGKEIGYGSFETHNAPIIGVSLAQESGNVKNRGLTLRGTEFPGELSAENKELLAKASALNQEGLGFYKEKKLDEAAEKTLAALEIYRQVHGAGHNDVANSLHNVATVLRDSGKTAESIPYYEEAIKVRSALFGADHPDVALLEMELTSTLVTRMELEAAFLHCLRANASFSRYYGPENRHTKVTGQMLEKLPRPKDKDET